MSGNADVPAGGAAEDSAGTTRWYPRLLVALGFLSLPRGFDRVLSPAAEAVIMRGLKPTSLVAYFSATLIVGVLAAVGAGHLLDRRGVIGPPFVGLIVWAAVTALAATTAQTDDLILIRTIGFAALTAAYFAISAVQQRAYPRERHATVIAATSLMTTTWIVGVPMIFHVLVATKFVMPDHAWKVAFLSAGSTGLLAAFAWRLTSRAPDFRVLLAPSAPASGWIDLLPLARRRESLGLAIILACYTTLYSIGLRILPVYLQRAREFDFTTLVLTLSVPLVIYAVAMVMASLRSDRLLRQKGQIATARRPFIVAGFCLAAMIAFVPLLGGIWLAMAIGIAAAGIAMVGLIGALLLDILPRALFGRALGCLVAFAFLVNGTTEWFAGFVVLRTNGYAPYFVLAAIAALVGAVTTAWMLHGITPFGATQSRDERITRVFT